MTISGGGAVAVEVAGVETGAVDLSSAVDVSRAAVAGALLMSDDGGDNVSGQGGSSPPPIDGFEGIDGLNKVGDNTWKSDGGLIYGYDPVFENRVNHVLEHLKSDFSKPMHTVFKSSRKEVFRLIDEAWSMKSSIEPVVQGGGKLLYEIPMDRDIGRSGETWIRIVVKDGVKVITSFPIV